MEINLRFFFPIIDTILYQIRRRFEGLYEVASTFSFLNPSSLKENNEADIIKASYDFAILVLILLDNMVNYIIENDLSSSFPDIITVCSTFLTIPVTVASAERSFSKQKLVKNYLERTEELNIDQIINNFANQKARKKN
ncbi:zinc finger MYM-type protein 1-like [Aphis craccivora]|uniref:Zinc finger MYM-type protein 1-like n=1 Tax=Aphis craccivora TaxID=307492 RepID=A0A6G0ZQZ4_APHCR|nr:zinc finger MYM-type protein 1-like [Aphis craccivora]